MNNNILYERLIEENVEKGFQVRLVVSDFKEVTYLHIRKYFLTYEGEWQASREGISIPASIENIYQLLYSLLDICSKAEGQEVIKFFYDNINKK